MNDSENRRLHNRRHTDRAYTRNKEGIDEDVVNPLKMRMFLGAIFTIFTLIVIFAPLWLFMFVIFWLMIDYFVMLGGTLNWLNQKVDIGFKGTGFFRRILATDARIICSTTSIAVLVLLTDYFYIPLDHVGSAFQWSDRLFSHSLHMFYSFHYYAQISVFNDINFISSREYIFTVLIRGLLIGSLIHVIHHLLINQHLAGVRFTNYPPIMSWMFRLVKWARK